MKPAPFEYAAPNTLSEAVSLLQQHAGEDVKILAGGQSLVPLLNMRMARPELLVDLNRIAELHYIREEGDWLAIGAMTRKRAVEESDLVRRRQPALLAATQLVGHPQIRNRGTVGGSMAHADPAAEYPALALVLEAELRVHRSRRRAQHRGRGFLPWLPGHRPRARRGPDGGAGPGPRPGNGLVLRGGGAPTRRLRAGRRDRDRHDSMADGNLSEVRIALFGVGPTPIRLRRSSGR